MVGRRLPQTIVFESIETELPNSMITRSLGELKSTDLFAIHGMVSNQQARLAVGLMVTQLSTQESTPHPQKPMFGADITLAPS